MSGVERRTILSLSPGDMLVPIDNNKHYTLGWRSFSGSHEGVPVTSIVINSDKDPHMQTITYMGPCKCFVCTHEKRYPVYKCHRILSAMDSGSVLFMVTSRDLLKALNEEGWEA
jgi:hypothetical protein